jgi:DNA mismatch endonuclease (patch repair protein)
MTDVFEEAKRREIMQSIRGKNSRPELLVRRLVHSMGYRYRLHSRSLPGAPDLVFSSRRKVIFIHGCFWHRHRCRKGQSVPGTRRKFWIAKLEGNKKRDERKRRALRRLGWRSLVIWECQTKDVDRLTDRIVRFLERSA